MAENSESTSEKNVFLSYSHSDQPFARRIANYLRNQSIDVFFDDWAIQPGDSIIEKIFEEGLKDTDVFLVLLSEDSVKSDWVKEELNAAMVQRIEGLTRVVPLLKEKCEVPPHLKALKWVDLSQDFEEGLDKIVQTIFQETRAPPEGDPPGYISTLDHPVGGLTNEASAIGHYIATASSRDNEPEPHFGNELLEDEFEDMDPEMINESINELESYGLIEALRGAGTAPFTFFQVTPTYALYLHFANHLPYDPEEDIKRVAAAIDSLETAQGEEIQQETDLPAHRINRAIEYLQDYDYIDVLRYLGTFPYTFGEAERTWRTRQFVNEHCR